MPKRQPLKPLSKKQSDLVARLAPVAASRGRTRYHTAGRPRRLTVDDFLSEAYWSLLDFVARNTGPDGRDLKGRTPGAFENHLKGRVYDRGTDMVRKHTRQRKALKKLFDQLSHEGRLPQD